MSLPALSPATSRRRRWRRTAFLGSTLVTIILLAAYAFARTTGSDDNQSRPVPVSRPKVTVAPVEEKVITESAEITGRVEAIERVELRARVSGHVDAVRFQAGQLVHKGDVLFAIDPRWYQTQCDLTAAQVRQERAFAESAEREAKRADTLLAVSAISPEDAEARRSRAATAAAALASAEAAWARARLDRENTEVRAPIEGRIGHALVTPGNLISGDPGSATLLATIVSEGDVFVYADIDERTLLKFNRLTPANRLSPPGGQIPAALQLADETGYPRHGYIESADNRLNPATGSLVLRLIFPNPDHALVPGLFVRVRIPVSAPQTSLLVSERAIGTDQSQKFVLAVTGEKQLAYRAVKIGPVVDGQRIIRSGLVAGENVVVNGLQRVRPGMTVETETVPAISAKARVEVNTVAAR